MDIVGSLTSIGYTWLGIGLVGTDHGTGAGAVTNVKRSAPVTQDLKEKISKLLIMMRKTSDERVGDHRQATFQTVSGGVTAMGLKTLASV